MCELPETTTQALVNHIAVHNPLVQTEQEATQYLASLATVTIASRAKLLTYTTMVQHFLGTLQLPMAVYMLDYYLPMLSPNEGHNETGLTMQSAGPIRQPWQQITFEFLFKGSEFGHWRVKGGQDAFAFRHPSLGKTEVFSLLASDAHHHKVSPIGTGRLVAMVGTADAPADDGRDLQILFGLVLAITPRTSKSKDELPASRIHRQCNPRFIEVAFLSGPAIEFFAQEQFLALQDWYVASGQRLEPIDATVQGQGGPLPGTFFLHTMWMFGCTKPTREVTAVAQTPPCRYHLGLGIYNVQTAVEGMDGNKRSHFLHLCGQLLRLVLIPCHVEGEPHQWTRTTALSFAAELDGHVLGTLCAVTMALLTNRLDLCIQGLFGAGKSKSMAILILALIEIDTTDSLKILFICKENSGTRSFADLLLWLDPPSGVFGRIGRLVGDQERNKSSYSHTKFDIHPRERRQMLNKCQLVLATGGTVAQDITMQWSTLGGFMQELSLMVIDEGQQYGTDREIAVISLMRQQPLVLWTGDSEQTPGGIDRAARNAKRYLPRAKEAPVQGIAQTAPTPGTEPTRSPEEEARDILATAAKNQPEDGPNTRRAAVRACKYLRAMVNQYESTIQAVHRAARTHTQRSKGAVGPTVDYRPQGEALPVISSDLTSELLHCLSTLPDPWPLAKITIDMEKPSQWVSKLCRLYFADEYARRTVGLPSPTHVPDIAAALRAVQTILPKLEVKMIEFLAEWLVTFLIPATHVLEVRAPHLSFMLLKEYWFRELYLGLKVTASFDRSESYTRVIDGQVRCITPEIKPRNLQVIWNVQFITVFVPAWMIPPVYHSLRRESIKSASSASAIGVQSVPPTWFEDIAAPKDTTPQPNQDPQGQQPQPTHGLKLVIKEEVLPMKDQPEFPSLELLAARGLLAPDTWKCKRAQVSLKATIDVPMLGTIIEQNGDGLLEDSHMPVGWPLHIDGAVRQCCIHRAASQQELDDMLKEYDMKRDSVEINHDAPQWSHHAVWNRRYMEPKPGYTLQQLWADSEPAIGKKTPPSYEIKASDILRAVAAITNLPSPTLPDSPFKRALGTSAAHKASPQTDTLAQRALEEWERTLCENKAVAILAEVQAGRPALIQKDGGEMLIAIVLDKPLAEAKALVDDPAAFTREMTRILREKQSHPLIAQMMKPAESSDPPPANAASSSTGSRDKPCTSQSVQFQ